MTVDHSTVTPALARTIHGAIAQRGVFHVEAPLFGGAAHVDSNVPADTLPDLMRKAGY